MNDLPEQETIPEDLKRSAEDLGEGDSAQRKKTMVEVDRLIAVADNRAQVEKEAAHRINVSLEGSASASAPAAPATA